MPAYCGSGLHRVPVTLKGHALAFDLSTFVEKCRMDIHRTWSMVAEELGCEQVLSSKPSRSLQMNMGAESAQGDLLLFLHADCNLPERCYILQSKASLLSCRSLLFLHGSSTAQVWPSKSLKVSMQVCRGNSSDKGPRR